MAEDVYTCLADGHRVFMDVPRDQYYCLTPDDTDTLARAIKTPTERRYVTDVSPLKDRKASRGERLVQTLVARQILVATSDEVSPFSESTNICAIASLRQGLHQSISLPRPRHVWHFLGAAISSSKQLENSSLAEALAATRFRKQACAKPNETSDIDRLLSAFTLLRPYYPRPYLCLFDSLALVHFLLAFGVCSDWVFGVRVAPFGAHCWVQIDNALVNDTIDNTRRYTPIMHV